MPESKDLSGAYITLVNVDHGHGKRSSPGDTVTLTHADAVLALAQRTVKATEADVGPRDMNDPEYIPTEAEFLAEAKKEYPAFVAHRTERRDRERAARADALDREAADAAMKDKALADQAAADEASAVAKAKADADAQVAVETQKTGGDAVAASTTSVATAAPQAETAVTNPRAEKKQK